MSVTCTSHNLGELEYITTQLKKDAFALYQLFEYDPQLGKADNFEEWYALLSDRVDFLQLHVFDICDWEKCLRSGNEFVSDSKKDSDG